MKMSDDFNTCKTKDAVAYDYFACQYFHSMTAYQATDNLGYWFGRTVAFGYTLEDFISAGTNFNEANLRSGLEKDTIVLHGYTLISVDYAPDQYDPDKATATGKVELDITLNGQRQTVEREFVHDIKRTWHATKTVFS